MKNTLKGLFAVLAVAATPALADAPYVGAVPGEPGAHRRPATTATQQSTPQATSSSLLAPSAPSQEQAAQTGYQIIPVGGRLAPCASLAQQFGVNWTPDEGRGFQQDGAIGCEYKAIPGPNGAPAAIPTGIHDLTRSNNAAVFSQMVNQAINRHSVPALSRQEQQQLMQGGVGYTSRYGLPYNHNPALPLPPVGIHGYVPNHGTPQINFQFRYPR